MPKRLPRPPPRRRPSTGPMPSCKTPETTRRWSGWSDEFPVVSAGPGGRGNTDPHTQLSKRPPGSSFIGARTVARLPPSTVHDPLHFRRTLVLPASCVHASLSCGHIGCRAVVPGGVQRQSGRAGRHTNRHGRHHPQHPVRDAQCRGLLSAGSLDPRDGHRLWLHLQCGGTQWAVRRAWVRISGGAGRQMDPGPGCGGFQAPRR